MGRSGACTSVPGIEETGTGGPAIGGGGSGKEDIRELSIRKVSGRRRGRGRSRDAGSRPDVGNTPGLRRGREGCGLVGAGTWGRRAASRRDGGLLDQDGGRSDFRGRFGEQPV